jgi:hypothetical protein
MITTERMRTMRLPDGTRSVQSPWVWRGFFFISLIALGLCLSLLASHDTLYAGAWGLITIGWFTISMWLWRKHTVHDDADWAARKRGDKPPLPVAPSAARRGGHVGSGGKIT